LSGPALGHRARDCATVRRPWATRYTSSAGVARGGGLQTSTSLTLRKESGRSCRPPGVSGRGGATLERSPDGASLWLVGGFDGGENNDLLRLDLRACE
jgi:hypothetical protein